MLSYQEWSLAIDFASQQVWSLSKIQDYEIFREFLPSLANSTLWE